MKTWLFLFLLLQTGCAIYRPYAPTTSIALGPKEDPIALVEGSSTNQWLFCLIPLSSFKNYSDSTARAIKNALSKVDADALVNMVVEREFILFPPFACTSITSVIGTAIKYKEAPNFRHVARQPRHSSSEAVIDAAPTKEQSPKPEVRNQ